MKIKRFYKTKIESISQWDDVLEVFAKEERKISYQKEIVYPVAKWIYRGQGDINWRFDSSFGRNIKSSWSSVSSENAFKIIESQMIEYFKKHVQSYVDIKMLSPIEILSMMQHYGVPTRLVDFTENAYVALFHAVYGRKEDNLNNDFTVLSIRQDWLMGMEVFNDEKTNETERYFSDLYNDEQEKEKSLKEGNHILCPLKYEGIRDKDDSSILCIYPENRNQRLEAQSGLFLMPKKLSETFENQLFDIVGDESREWQEKNIEELLNGKIDDVAGIMFVFSKELVHTVKMKLLLCNITHSKLFPDVSGLAQEVKELFSNKVIKEMDSGPDKPKLKLPLCLPVLTYDLFMKDRTENDYTKKELSILKETLNEN